MSIVRTLAAGFALSCLVAACEEAPAAISAAPVPASYVIVSGNAQTGAAGEKLPNPLVLRVVDANGNPVPGTIVNFRVVRGRNGEVFAGAAITDAQGLAADRWTLGTLSGDSQKVEVRSVTSTGQEQVHAVFVANAVPGAPSYVRASIGSVHAFSALRDTITFTAQAFDRFHNLTNAELSWFEKRRDTTVVNVLSNGFTEARANGIRDVIVRVGGLPGVQDTVKVYVAQVAASLEVSPDSVIMKAGTTRQLTATLRDRNGYLMTGSVVWRSSDLSKATVSSAGLVTAFSPGTAHIRVAKSGMTGTDETLVTVVP
jgi:hypothetical protein